MEKFLRKLCTEYNELTINFNMKCSRWIHNFIRLSIYRLLVNQMCQRIITCDSSCHGFNWRATMCTTSKQVISSDFYSNKRHRCVGDSCTKWTTLSIIKWKEYKFSTLLKSFKANQAGLLASKISYPKFTDFYLDDELNVYWIVIKTLPSPFTPPDF